MIRASDAISDAVRVSLILIGAAVVALYVLGALNIIEFKLYVGPVAACKGEAG